MEAAGFGRLRDHAEGLADAAADDPVTQPPDPGRLLGDCVRLPFWLWVVEAR